MAVVILNHLEIKFEVLRGSDGNLTASIKRN